MKKYVKIGLGVVVVIVVGWGLIAVSGSPGIDTLTQEAQSLRDDAPKYAAPDFTLQSIDGSQVTLSSFQGKKPVILDFWASWCPNCRRDLPVLNQLSQKYKDDIEVIAINLNETTSVATNFITNNGYNSLVTVLDPGGSTSRVYGVTYTNYHVLIDKDGVVQNAFAGDISEAHFQKLLETEVEPTTPEPLRT